MRARMHVHVWVLQDGRVGLLHWIPDTFKECEKMADIRRVNLKTISVHVML